MKISHIVPTNQPLLNTSYYMMLAHLCDNPEYLNAHNTAHVRGGYRILDNSIIELGEAFDIDKLLDVADKVMPNEIILPDVFQDGTATLTKVREAISTIKERYEDTVPFKLMAVAQGKDVNEWMECYEELLTYEEIDVIGVPKLLDGLLLGSRNLVLSKIDKHERRDTKEYHLLGVHNNLEEVQTYSVIYPWIRGVDTCMLYILSRDGIKLDPFTGAPRPQETINFEDIPSAHVQEIMEANKQIVDMWIKVGEEVNF